MKNYAIILASGSSSRFGGELPKQFIEIDGKTILEHSVNAFEINENITDIIVVCNPDYIELSYIGVSLVEEDNANVLIHDGARPFVSQKIINDCIEGLKKFDALGVAIESNDTMIKLDEKGFICEIPQRASLRRIQTPQCFKADIIKKAHELAKEDKSLVVTDDCGMVLHFNLAKIAVIEGDNANIKITHQSDLQK